MSTRVHRSFAALGLAATLVVAPLAACSSDDDGDDATTTTTTEAAESTTTAGDDGDETTTTAGDDATTTTTEAEETSGEIGTTGVRDFLNEEAPELGLLFDWDQGDGIIAVTYLGVQTVQLYAAEIDAPTATEACETASSYVFGLDATAKIEVYTGGYSNSSLVVSREGEAGTCAAA